MRPGGAECPTDIRLAPTGAERKQSLSGSGAEPHLSPVLCIYSCE